MKVLREFYCVQENKSYKVGDDYTGKRKDLGGFLEKPKTRKTKNAAPKNLEDK